MIYRIEVAPRLGTADSAGERLRGQASALGLEGIREIRCTRLYFVSGALDVAAIARLADELLCDPVTETAAIRPVGAQPAACLIDDGAVVEAADQETRGRTPAWIEVVLRPGVTDSEAESLLDGARLVGISGLEQAATGRSYFITGAVTTPDLVRLAEGLLSNAVIQTYAINAAAEPPLGPVTATQASRSAPAEWVEIIPLTDASDAELEGVSRERRLSLDLAEMKAIQRHFHGLGRPPTDVELESLAQTWSEHCIHKTFRALISYEERSPARAAAGDVPKTMLIDSLLDTYIRRATETVAKPWVRSALAGNAGTIAFDDRYDLAFKVETHNHPSALEPFGGANTGVGGVIRDIIGTSARPIANTDVLCFGPPDLPFSALPAGVLHPRRVADGVIGGIEDYGNKMGIPTVNGAILHAAEYTANPLVFCGCLGILPRGSHPAAAQAGDLVVVIGGRTGRDGLRGATFSSMEMDHETGGVAGSAVQIGHPIHEKQALEAIMVARDEGLYSDITDCGAGGLSSAIGEMAADLGADIDLDRAPLKYSGLLPWEIWLSEAQERMVLAVPAAHWPRLQEVCAAVDAEATELGHLTGNGQITLRYRGTIVGQLDAAFLHHGMPRRTLRAVWTAPAANEPGPEQLRSQPPPVGETGTPGRAGDDFAESLRQILAMPDQRSKEDVVRRYDHEVQGATAMRPFSGPSHAGPTDAAVLNLAFATGSWADDPTPASPAMPPLARRGVALAAGINPHYGALDPYAMAWAAVDEAIRNCVAAGTDPDQVALVDNFCWGNPLLADRLGGLVRCAQGCHDAAVAYGAPFISGKDSLNNEFTGVDGRKHAIPGTLLISAIGIVPDVAYAAGSDLKAPGDWLYGAGYTRDELGESAYRRLQGIGGTNVPQAQPHSLDLFHALYRAISAGLVQAIHDCSEGGLAAAVAEMALGGELGARVELGALPRPAGTDRAEVLLFSESLSRFVVEVAPGDAAAFEACLAGLPAARIGAVLGEPAVCFQGTDGRNVLVTDLAALDLAWRGHLT